MSVCDPAAKEGKTELCREVGGEATPNQKVSVDFNGPRLHTLPKVLISLNALFLTILSMGSNGTFSK